ncbi:hypothetical protein [Leadbettera azotonutricia]|uniref:Capsule assembly protein Wzi n=1 Tax=Leadbettera azotonutricia (strain ATCC BAA-888 / DSM 13862 / ZAS-9) TaxID=545695 RepID=F5Y9J6_LEAAZ|nr:hypothetical protein [Leadbettera azotonutricia]AEF81359.1 hypothetical protein TREAZ_0843 [Leadbettera azotonutricia ZAS-9]
MNPIKALPLFLCLLLPLAVFGQTQEMLLLSSVAYDEMDTLYLLKGLGSPSSARPWTKAEASLILDKIDSSALSAKEQALYDHIASLVYEPLRFSLDKLATLDAGLEFALEAYMHTNSSDYVREEDWVYGYEERRPLLNAYLELNLGSWFSVYTDARYGRNRFNQRDLNRDSGDLPGGLGAVIPPNPETGVPFPYYSWAYSRPFLSNVPTGIDEFDFDWPKRAVLTLGGAHWNISLARDKLQWGRGKTGNFVFDSHRDYDEYFKVSAFSSNFKYEWLNVFYTSPESMGEPLKIFMAHRLEFRLFPSLVLAVSENIIYKGEGFNPRYLNPAFIFHNWLDRTMFNALAHLELDFAPVKGYRLYIQTVFDQIRATWEDDIEPWSWGMLGGIEHARFAGPGVLNLSLEAAYTSPLLYRRDEVDFITLGTTRVNGSPDPLYFDYTGYPYGGDALVFQIDSSYRFPNSALLSGRFFAMVHGKMNPFVSHNKEGNNTGLANLDSHTPSGSTDEQELTLGAMFKGSYGFPKKFLRLTLTAWSELDLLFKKNKLMVSENGTGESLVYHKPGWAGDFQFSLGFGLKI